MSSLAPFLFDWRGDSWDRAERKRKDAEGNPLEVWFYRRDQLILKLFIIYDDDGDWESLKTEKPKPEPKKTGKG